MFCKLGCFPLQLLLWNRIQKKSEVDYDLDKTVSLHNMKISLKFLRGNIINCKIVQSSKYN